MPMKMRPVRKYPTPRYPERELFVLHPELLYQYAPTSWKMKEAVAGALLAFVAAGCTRTEQPPAEQPQPSATESTQTSAAAALRRKKVLQANRPPLFIHGEGRGATGCIAQAPPVFLPENEARQVIEEELRKSGIAFDTSGTIVGKGLFSEGVALDGLSSSTKIGYIFVSCEDEEKARANSRWQSSSSVQTIDVLSLAQKIHKTALGSKDITTAVFYDPAAKYDRTKARLTEDSSSTETKYVNPQEEVRKRGKELLRQQVHSFTEWLKQNR